jgi:ABC-type lipoprotein release transport system permease subunit
MIIRMAWRNLWRNRRRTLITLGSVAFGLFLAITFTGLGHGGWGKVVDSAARMNSGHVTIEPKGYRDAPSTDLFLQDAEGVAASVKGMRGVAGVNVRVLGNAMASTAAGSQGAAFFGIDPAAERDTLIVLKHLRAGAGLSEGAKNEVLVGKKLAEQLEMKTGSKMVITSTDMKGEVVSGLVRVKGIYETGVPEVDRSLLVVHIGWARSFLGYGEKGGTQVAILLSDRRNSEGLARELGPAAARHGGTVLTWPETMPELAATLNMDNRSNYIMQVIIFLLIGAGILNTVLMGVLERFHELGVMRAVGMTPWRLWSMVMTECVFLALLGLAAGLSVTAPVYAYLSTSGIDLSGLMKEKATIGNVAFDPSYTAELHPETLAVILALVFALNMAAGLYPAFVASRTKPLDAIRRN